MPTLIVEDGTASSASANTYVTVAEVTTFCSDYGLSGWSTLSTTDQETAIIRGMAYVETFNFKGIKMSWEDPLEWPRYGVWDESYTGAMEDWSSEELAFYQEIPKGLKRAVCRAAYEESQSAGCLQSSGTSNIKREKIDVIETEYFFNEVSVTVYRTIEGFLKGLINSSNTATVRRC
jgi:hypothetical protein